MNKKNVSLALLSSMAMMLLAGGCFAAEPIEGFSKTSIENIITWAADWLFGIVLSVGIIMIIVAGLVWITSAGNQERVTMARKMLIWGLIGIAVVLVSYSAVNFVYSIITAA